MVNLRSRFPKWVGLLFLASFSASAWAEPYSVDFASAEKKAALEQQLFNDEFELVEPNEDSLSGEPDWYHLLRPSIRVRRRVGGRTRTTTTIPDVTYGVLLTGPANYSEGLDLSIPPASTNKLFTAALALEALGGDYVYSTKVSWLAHTDKRASALVITGAGDFSLTGAGLLQLAEEIATALKAEGILRISGPIVVTASDLRWEKRTIPEGWLAKDLHGNTFVPGAYGAANFAQVEARVRSTLLKRGLLFDTKPTPSEDAGTPREFVHPSKPLRELIRPFLLDSINFIGEALLRKVGEIRGSTATEDLHSAGLPVLREYASKNIGTSTVTLYDGCGLSRKSRVTARAMGALLDGLRSEPFFLDLLHALPVAGRSGTLDTRMNRTAAEGHIHAKTGTLDGHYQIAGYLRKVEAGREEYHPFVILTSTAATYAGYCRSTQDHVLARFSAE